MTNKQIQGFRVLPVKFSATSTANHELFIKEHIIRHKTPDKPSGRTLFVLNVPPYATKDSFKRVFGAAGPVENVIFQKNVTSSVSNDQNPENDSLTDEHNLETDIKGFKIAFVVFEKPQGLLKALKLSTLEPLSTPKSKIIVGIKKWVQEYNKNIPDPKLLQKEIDQFMENFDNEVKESQNKEKENKEDEEGWITVTKHSRNPGLARKEAVENKIKDKIEKSKKKKELKNFYTFQIRDSKMKHLATLRKKFEEDKKKITALKEARRFKPF